MDDLFNFCPIIMIQNGNLRHNYQRIRFSLHRNLRARTSARQKGQKLNFPRKTTFSVIFTYESHDVKNELFITFSTHRHVRFGAYSVRFHMSSQSSTASGRAPPPSKPSCARRFVRNEECF